MATDVLTLPRKLRLPLWGIGLGILAAFATLVSNTFTTEVTTNESNWETQGASNCSDAYGSFDAFIPGMRGFGSCNRGGFIPGTTVIRVSNRDGSGSESLQEALNANCPKVILFDVGGRIDRDGAGFVAKDCDNWSVVGASAPGEVALSGTNGPPLFRTQGDNWTIDHLTMASGDYTIFPGGETNRDVLAFGTGGNGAMDNGIALNNTMLWGLDEVLQCYPPLGSEQTNILYWQNLIGVVMEKEDPGAAKAAGLHIIQNTCQNNSSIRNAYIHSHERVPKVRADKYFHANNFSANVANRVADIAPCDGQYTPNDAQVRANFIHNLNAKSQNSASAQRYLENVGGNTCTDFQIYEEGNRVREDDGTLYDCDTNHACSGNIDAFSAGDWETSSIAAAYPTGYIPETITNTQAGLEAFANQIVTYVGSRPTNRLSYAQTRLVDEGIDIVDGTDTSSTYVSRSTVADEGGISQITPSDTSWNPTTQCGGMPTGAAADNIEASGLTALHEWAITCFYDSVMPSGYRESETGLPAP